MIGLRVIVLPYSHISIPLSELTVSHSYHSPRSYECWGNRKNQRFRDAAENIEWSISVILGWIWTIHQGNSDVLYSHHWLSCMYWHPLQHRTCIPNAFSSLEKITLALKGRELKFIVRRNEEYFSMLLSKSDEKKRLPQDELRVSSTHVQSINGVVITWLATTTGICAGSDTSYDSEQKRTSQ